MRRRRALVLSVLAGLPMVTPVCALAAGEAPQPLHIEFLWERPQTGTGVRAEALGLLQEADASHQLCWKSPVPLAGPLEVVVSAEDAKGHPVLQDAYRLERASTRVHCRSLSLAIPAAAPGIWRFTVAIGGLAGGSASIEVARALGEAGFAADPMRPYVRGRLNYASAFAGHSGELQWVIDVAADGSVRDVHTEPGSGLPDELVRRGERAARLYRFPADPRRSAPMALRQSFVIRW